MNGCIYRTKDNECELWEKDRNCSAYCHPNCENRHPSNADRIRAMTDEELADFIGGIFTIESDPWGDYDPRTVVMQEPRVELRNREDALDWLKQEATK